MAAGNASKILGDIGERHLECPICTNRFREPKMLNCFHSFCLQCLQDLSRGQDPQRMKLKCPLCRRETILSGNGVAQLPNNFTLSALVEEFAVQEKLACGQDTKIICNGCEENNAASSFCMDCAHFLCPDCQRPHERFKLTKSHKIYTLAQLQSGEVTYKSPLREIPMCQKHQKQSLEIYCNTCQKVICTTCSVLDHEKHSRSGLPKALEECKQEVAALTTQAEEKKTALSTARDNTDKARKKLDTMFAETIQKISTKANKEVDKIRAMELKLNQEAEKMYTERVKTFETVQVTNSNRLDQAEIMLNEVGRVMSQASCCEILDLKEKLLDNLKEVTEQEPEQVPDKLSFIGFQDADKRSLGRLVLKDEWILKTNIQINKPGELQDRRYIDDVAAFSNGQIVTVDRERKRLCHFVPTNNPQAPFISEELQSAGLNDPTHVAVNKADQLIVLDGDAVKTLSREYRLLNEFRPGEKSNSEPTCLAVDDSNLIGVGDGDKEEISLHNPDGSLIRRLAAPHIGNHLTISKKRFIFIERITSRVRSVDYNGDKQVVDIKRKHADPEGSTLKCKSICCDRHGSMFIQEKKGRWYDLFGSALRNNEIAQYDSDGRHIKTIIANVDAHCITFTQEGDLVVATGRCIEIYCHM